MQIKIPRTTLKKIGQEETVTLSFAHGKKKEDLGGWSFHEVEH